MAALAGKGGQVTIGTLVVGEIEEWQYTPMLELYEKTKFNDTAKTRLAGVTDGSGSFKGRHDQTDAQQQTLTSSLFTPALVALRLYTDTAGAHYYSGNAWIKAKAMKASVLSLVEVQYDFQADGVWGYT